MSFKVSSSEVIDDIQVFLEGFVKESFSLLKQSNLQPPCEEIPTIEFSYEIVRCFDPKIGFHDFNPIRNYGYLEALGTYINDFNNIENQKFLLFINNIQEVAAVYTLSYKRINVTDPLFIDKYNIYIQQITALVVCHVFSHWLVCRSIDNNGKSLFQFKCQKIDELFYHEALAQAIVFQSLVNSSDIERNDWGGSALLELMLWMEGGQPDQYIAYKRLGKDTVKILNAMDILRPTNFQSYELLEKTINLINGEVLPDLDKIFDSFFRQPITESFHEEIKKDVELYLKENLPNTANRLRGVINGKKFGL
jgi:hypothetical protein